MAPFGSGFSRAASSRRKDTTIGSRIRGARATRHRRPGNDEMRALISLVIQAKAGAQ
jgi:hypothetical protein